MLSALSITDFVLIRRLDLAPGNGLTALTGETGAGKSIILDALSAALGAPAQKRFVRAGAERAVVAAEFALLPSHPLWDALDEAGIEADRGETVTFRRIIPASGPSRATVNGQPLPAAEAARLGEWLVEIHGQHAAMGLMKPSNHRALLDSYAGCGEQLDACAAAWGALQEARAAREALEAGIAAAREEQDWLEESVGELAKLAPQGGEADQLAARRQRLMQSERIGELIGDAEKALSQGGGAEDALSKAGRQLSRILSLPALASAGGADANSEAGGADPETDELVRAARQAAEGLERALIELQEASGHLEQLGYLAVHDAQALDDAETRLFALKGAARKYKVQPDELAALAAELRGRLESLESGEADLAKAKAEEKARAARWHAAADALTRAREAAASRLAAAVKAELAPLKLGKASFRVGLSPLPDTEAGAQGKDAIAFEVETNPGAGFGPLRTIASGGELARFSLALKCALAETGAADVLIFDEADQGVGGAVASAIGERLGRLASAGRQVFTITHSPQVAAHGAEQWLVSKSAKGAGGQTRVTPLSDEARAEELARMLSGASVTDEARAAAARLLEAGALAED